MLLERGKLGRRQHGQLQARGVEFAQTLKEQPWGASDFLVRDSDGNLLCFASVPEDA